MAVIELRDTGKMLLTGLRRPTHTLFRAISYSVWDMFCLAASLAIAMWTVESQRVDFWHSWFLEMPVWVTPTFSLLAISRAYVTVWTRARILDVLILLFTLQAGLLLSLGIALLIDPSNAYNWLLRALVMAAIGHAGIIGVRVFYRSVEEIVFFLRPQKDPVADAQRIVLYGAGRKCQLILKERSFNNTSSFEGCTIVGLIDDEPALHFKWVYGHLVFGDGRDLPKLVEKHRITGIVITTKLNPETFATVRDLAARHGLSLNEWRFESKVIDTGVRSSREEFIPVEAATKTSD
jgi:FlaA1/EpsC-like NDP-sugar epimerase